MLDLISSGFLRVFPCRLTSVAIAARLVVMPTRNVSLTPALDEFVAAVLETGRYENASEVVRAGLRALQDEERIFQKKLERLDDMLDEGEASGYAEDSSLEGVMAEVRQRRAARDSAGGKIKVRARHAAGSRASRG